MLLYCGKPMMYVIPLLFPSWYKNSNEVDKRVKENAGEVFCLMQQ
jgi:hypothetical protein